MYQNSKINDDFNLKTAYDLYTHLKYHDKYKNNYVFENKSALNAWLKNHSYSLKIGDLLLIDDVNSPDYWWNGHELKVFKNSTLSNEITLEYKGKWDAVTNTPFLPEIPENIGNFWIVINGGKRFGIQFVTHGWIVAGENVWLNVDFT